MAKAKAEIPAPDDFVKTATDFETTLTGADLARFRGYVTDEKMARRVVADRKESEWKALVLGLRTAGR